MWCQIMSTALRVSSICAMAFILLPVSLLGAQEKGSKDVLAFPSGEELAGRKAGPPDYLSFDIIRTSEGCVGFMAYFRAGTFFRGMKRINTPQGPVFRKGKVTVTQFPDEMDLIIVAHPGRCSIGAPPNPSWRGDWPPDWIKSPRPEGSLIRNLKAESLSISLAEEGSSRGDYPIYTPWEYRFVVETKGVQLSDMMRFVLFRKSGEKLAEFNYRP